MFPNLKCYHVFFSSFCHDFIAHNHLYFVSFTQHNIFEMKHFCSKINMEKYIIPHACVYQLNPVPKIHLTYFNKYSLNMLMFNSVILFFLFTLVGYSIGSTWRNFPLSFFLQLLNVKHHLMNIQLNALFKGSSSCSEVKPQQFICQRKT